MKADSNREVTLAKKQVNRAMAWSAVTRAASRVNSSKSKIKLDEAIFFERLRISRRIRERDWGRIKDAFESRNWVFLDKLLKTLKKEPKSPFKKDTLAENFLRANWTTVHALTDEEILAKAQEWCCRNNKHPDSISDDSIKKARQRLGFSKSKQSG